MKKYVFILPVFIFLLSCKTQSDLDDNKIVFNDVLENSISLHAYEPHGRVYPGRVSRTDTIIVYGNFPQVTIDSILTVRKTK